MPEFEFTITHETTVSARVKIEADSIEEAHFIATSADYYDDPANNVQWELDEGNEIGEVYVPDPDDFEIVDSAEDDASEENSSSPGMAR